MQHSSFPSKSAQWRRANWFTVPACLAVNKGAVLGVSDSSQFQIPQQCWSSPLIPTGILEVVLRRNSLWLLFGLKTYCLYLRRQGVKIGLCYLVSLSWQKKKKKWREGEFEKQKLKCQQNCDKLEFLHGSLPWSSCKKQNYWQGYSETSN